MSATRKEKPVKNNPGIAKVLVYCRETSRWIESGKYRAVRRLRVNGQSKRESGFFDNIEDAKLFRAGRIEKAESQTEHRVFNVDDGRLRFRALVEKWKVFHYLGIEKSSSLTYDEQLKMTESALGDCVVDEITPEVIDKMIAKWKVEHGQALLSGEANKQRTSFRRQLDVLKLVLGYYKMRLNYAYVVPIYRDHYRAARIVTKAKSGPKSIRREDLGGFFRALMEQRNPHYFLLALIQFCLSLRICEACGLDWSDFDFARNEVTIGRSVVWDRNTWDASIKDRPKNGQERLLAMPAVLAARLKELWISKGRPQSGRVFLVLRKKKLEDGTHEMVEVLMNRKNICNAYNRALLTAGITYVTGTHVMRKTSATQANASTGDVYAVSENLGHSNIEETLRYVEGVPETRQRVANALNNVVVELMRQAT